MKYENEVLISMPNINVLGEKISKRLKLPLTKIKEIRYADGEGVFVSEGTVRNKNVYLVASVSQPVNDNLMNLLLMIDSLKRAHAKSITIIKTYYGYARQDRKVGGRYPIGAKLVADLLQVAGATKVIAVDLHNPAIQGFFNIPIDNIMGQYALAQKIKDYFYDFTVVSPDHGGTTRARKLAELIANTIKITIIDKRRTGPDQLDVVGLIGNIKNQNAVIMDDIIDTGNTIIKAAKELKKHGAKKIIVAATHGIFSKGFEMFEKNKDIDKIFITDSIDKYDLAKKYKKLEIVSLDKILADVISCSINDESVNELFEKLAMKLKSK